MEVLDHFFAQNHYTVLYPEQIPLRKMIFYMQNVKNVASISGSPLHNILFGRRNQKMTIFERCAVNNEWQVSVNRMMDLDITYVDANISIYPVAMSGPFIVGCNDILLRYAQDMQMIPPKDTFRSKRFYRKCFVRYMRAYKKQYGYMWFMPDYLIRAADYHVEAFEDCLQYFGLYLKGVLPFRWHHYLTPHYWKAFLKFFLQKTHKIP